MFSSLSRYFHQWAIKSHLLDPGLGPSGLRSKRDCVYSAISCPDFCLVKCMAWCLISEFGWEVNEKQVNIRWMPATPDGNLENVTVVVSLDIHQDVVPVKKPRIEVYWSLFQLRLHKFSRPEYRRERFLR